MQREIKFRGKRKGAGNEWLYGDLNHIDGKVYIFQRTEDAPLNSPDWFEVIPETVGQFTGLKDKNLKEMYVGDIVIGHRIRLSGDGYIKKGFPHQVRYFHEIIWADGKFFNPGFQLKEICVHPEDKFATDKYQYRKIGYHLAETRETFLKNNEYVWKGYCKTLEIINTIYDNPELLK